MRIRSWQRSAADAEEDHMNSEALPAVNTDNKRLLEKVRCFALDMDGTVYLGNNWIDGALDFLKKVEASGRQFVFLTNNSSRSSDMYMEKLHDMGLDIRRDQLITSAQATMRYIKLHFPDQKVFLLGNELLKRDFEEQGILLEEEHPGVVVTAFDTSLTYAKLCKVCDLVRDGCPYIATHPDYNCPTETGFVPDIGSIHAFIKASAFRMPDTIIGKPNVEMAEYLLWRTRMQREETAVAGDRIYTDIEMGKRNGLLSVFVLSGEAGIKDINRPDEIPDLIFTSVKDIIPLLTDIDR